MRPEKRASYLHVGGGEPIGKDAKASGFAPTFFERMGLGP